jgi:predicted HicB family RNase H-like nuclease
MAIKRRKPAEQRKTVYLRVRITEVHEKEIKAAAAKAGISVSAWVVERLLKAARQENRVS